MRTGISSYSLWKLIRKGGISTEEVFQYMRRIGCEAIEISEFTVPLYPDPDASYDPEALKRIQDYSSKYDVPIGAYSCASDAGRVRPEALPRVLEYVHERIDLAHRLGAPVIRVDLVQMPAGADLGVSAFEEILPQCVAAAQDFADYAAQYHMDVTMENHGMMMNGCDRVRRLVECVNRPNYGVTLDVGNMLCVDDDPLVCTLEWLPYVKNVHAKDFYIRKDPLSCGAKILHPETVSDPEVLGSSRWITTRHNRYLRGAIAGQGDIDMQELLNLLVSSGFNGDFLIEFEGMEDPKLGSELGLINLRQMLETARQSF